jgi:prepilin-type processing-associated H-X9-DG protein
LPSTDAANGFSAQARLLPYIEEASLQSALDFTQPAFTGAYNAQVPNPLFAVAFATPVALFLCPSDPAPVVNAVTVSSVSYSYAGNNYMLSTGSGTGLNYDQRFPTDGITYYNSAVQFRKITDGTSNTVFMSEAVRSVGNDLTLAAGLTPPFPYQATLNGSSGLTPGNGPGITVTGSPWTAGPNGMVANPVLSAIWTAFNPATWRGANDGTMRGRGTCWAAEGSLNTLTNGYTPPNSVIPDVVTHHAGFFGPRSWHSGGANVLFGDGSVRFLADDIDATVHRNLHSCNGAEVIGAGAF